MISKPKKRSYKLFAAAIVLVIALSAILLIKVSDAGKSDEQENTTQVSDSKLDFSPLYDNTFRWFSSLYRALDFPKYDFKVPDYLPKGYQLVDISYFKNFTIANDADLIDIASITFAANFGTENEQRIEVLASKGNGNLLEHNKLRGAHYPQNASETKKYRQETITIGLVEGTLFTDKRPYKQRPETGKSFYWQDGSVWYAINYYREHMSQEELTKMVQSFVAPQQVQHVRYDGEGNSFPLYDEKDLLAAENILGFKVKIPSELPGLNLSSSTLLQSGDQNTGYSFKQVTDALWTYYRPVKDSSIYKTNDNFSVYQSKEPLFDASKLSFTDKLEVHSFEISKYEDPKHLYTSRVYSSSGKIIKSPIYLWKQDNIYYAAIFSGMDTYQEDNLKAIISAPM